MAVKRLTNVRLQFEDGNGLPASGYRLFFNANRSSTLQNTYNDSTGLIANSNPIVLNALGEPATEIWLTVGLAYTVGMAIPGVDSPPASFIWQENDVVGVNDTSFPSVDQWQPSLLTPTFISATSFSLVGDQTSTFQPGRAVKTTNSGGTTYSQILTSVFAAGITTITLYNLSGTVDAGISAASYGLLSGTNNALPAAQPVSWTPAMIGTGGGPLSFAIAVGTKIKVGNLVFFSCTLQCNGGVAITGPCQISGIGETGSVGFSQPCAVAAYGNVTMAANYTQLSAYVSGGGNTILIYQSGSAQAGLALPGGNFGNTSFISVGGVFRIN